MIQRDAKRVSASRLKLMDDCTMKFYLSEIMRLPEKTWPRTHAGSASHAILECLARNKHRHHHDKVKAAGTIYASPEVTRLLKRWTIKTGMEPKIVADIDGMCMLAINLTNFLDEGAIRRFDPEHEFKMTLPNGAVVKGYIDRLAQYADTWVVWDYKSQRERFDDDEVRDSFQSLVYQWYVWRTFGALAEVRYIMLRHPPTSRTPNKHIQITPPATPAQLEGFESYLEHMYETINSFSEKDARVKYHCDKSFCDRVCSFKASWQYLHITDKTTGALIGNFPLDKRPQVDEDKVNIETRHFKGCVRFNP